MPKYSQEKNEGDFLLTEINMYYKAMFAIYGTN